MFLCPSLPRLAIHPRSCSMVFFKMARAVILHAQSTDDMCEVISLMSYKLCCCRCCCCCSCYLHRCLASGEGIVTLCVCVSAELQLHAALVLAAKVMRCIQCCLVVVVVGVLLLFIYSVPWHCWLSDSESIWPVKTCYSSPSRFCLGDPA